jgi:hypothetical protein
MWLLVLSDWVSLHRSRPRNIITEAPRRQFSQEAAHLNDLPQNAPGRT